VIADVVDVAWTVASALEAIGAAYYIGGSVASSLQSSARSTQDIDFVVEMRPGHAQQLADALGPDFSVDVEALRDAIARQWSWNIFHLPSGLKIDLMMRKDTPYDREAFARRRRFRIDVDVEPYVKSVEDSILKKLQWYRDGGEVVSTQWRDVVELIRVNTSALDRAYLTHWAPQLGIADLLAKAELEARTGVRSS
jgi:hypothetical protein